MLREDLRLIDVSAYVKEAQSHRAIAADGLRQTRKAVEARRPIDECRTSSTPPSRARSKRAAGPGLRQINIDARSAKAERPIGTAQLENGASGAGRARRRGRGRALAPSL